MPETTPFDMASLKGLAPALRMVLFFVVLAPLPSLAPAWVDAAVRAVMFAAGDFMVLPGDMREKRELLPRMPCLVPS